MSKKIKLKTKSTIKSKIYQAFEDYFNNHNLFTLTRKVADIIDRVRYQWQANLVYEAIGEVQGLKLK